MSKRVRARQRLRFAAAAAALASAAFALPGSAQLPQGTPQALGLGGNFAAVGRGWEALAWNPALLGLADNALFSLAVMPVTARTGLSPIGLGHLRSFAGDSVPRSERDRWMLEIEGERGQKGGASGDVTYLATSVGGFAFQVSTHARAEADLSPGAAEILLFGNAGRSGTPCECVLSGSAAQAHAVTTAAAGFAVPLELPGLGPASLGLTLKYSLGHLFARGMDAGGFTTSQPVFDVRFPIIRSDTASRANAGSGWGLDVGGAVMREGMTLSVALQNVVQTFAWDEAKLRFLPGTALLTADVQEADFDEQPFASAPREMREHVADQRFRPALVAGVTVERSERLSLSGDLRARPGDSAIDPLPAFHLGAGAEYRLPVVALRGGAAVRDGGFQVGAGLGVSLGPLELGAAVLSRSGGPDEGLVTSLSLLSVRR